MKRSEVKLTLDDRIRILRQQAIQLLGRNQQEVATKRKERITANKEYLTLVEAQELVEAMQRAGMSWQELRDIVELHRPQRQPAQKKLFHP